MFSIGSSETPILIKTLAQLCEKKDLIKIYYKEGFLFFVLSKNTYTFSYRCKIDNVEGKDVTKISGVVGAENFIAIAKNLTKLKHALYMEIEDSHLMCSSEGSAVQIPIVNDDKIEENTIDMSKVYSPNVVWNEIDSQNLLLCIKSQDKSQPYRVSITNDYLSTSQKSKYFFSYAYSKNIHTFNGSGMSLVVNESVSRILTNFLTFTKQIYITTTKNTFILRSERSVCIIQSRWEKMNNSDTGINTEVEKFHSETKDEGLEINGKEMIDSLNLHVSNKSPGAITTIEKDMDSMVILTNNPGRFYASSEIPINNKTEKQFRVGLNYYIISLIKEKLEKAVNFYLSSESNKLIFKWIHKDINYFLETSVLNI